MLRIPLELWREHSILLGENPWDFLLRAFIVKLNTKAVGFS